MSERPTQEMYVLLSNLDAWIDDALKHSKPIGLTLTRARSKIKGQHDRIAEMWDALEYLRELAKNYKEYAQLLGDEIDSMAPIAFTHGWESSRAEQGKVLRERIKQLEEGGAK
jgi:hypothetical protein